MQTSKEIFAFLKKYPSDIFSIDSLFATTYILKNEINVLNNRLVLDHIIADQNAQLLEFLELVNIYYDSFKLENLIELFEFVISPEDRIVNGAIYTPDNIRTYITEKSFSMIDDEDFNQVKISDIACGCGGFLYTATNILKDKTRNSYEDIFANNIFGLDLQQYSVNRSKLLLSLLAITHGEDIIEFNFNLYQGDALTFKWENYIDLYQGFTCVLGNPPYVRYRNLDIQTRENVKKWDVGTSGLTDLYIPFFQIGTENLSPNGVLGYITMNSFFKSLNGRALRSYYARQNLKFIIEDFGAEQIFKERNTYVCICFIQNTFCDTLAYTETNEKLLTTDKHYEVLSYSILDSKKGWNLKNNVNVQMIENIGQPFGNLYKTRHGIATLKNDIYIFKPIHEDDEFYYLQNGERHAIEKDICRNIVNSNKLSRIKSLQQLNEKIIFPYSMSGKADILQEDELREKYPNAYRYLQYKRKILESRDKGKAIDYDNWYAFGRTQSLEKMTHKLFFPKFSDITPSFLANHDENLMFYNGLALIGNEAEDLEIVRKIMESDIFWYYIKNTSKPYSGNYFSLNSTYINNFGVCDINDNEKTFLLEENDKDVLNEFFSDKYQISI